MDRTGQRARVAVTGIGIVSPMGIGCEANAEGFRAGRLAFRDVSLFDTSRHRTGRAGEVELPDDIPTGWLDGARRRRALMDRALSMVLLAGDEAAGQAGWVATDDEIPICFGTSAAGMPLGERFYMARLESPESRRGQMELAMGYAPGTQLQLFAEAQGLRGPRRAIANACASGSNALGHAYRLVQSGRARRAVAGGYDGLCSLVFSGFDSLQALSEGLPRPFDAGRDGLALGEGAAVFYLERWSDAIGRGAEIYGEVEGYGVATDLHHLTQPHPCGLAAIASMCEACRDAGIGAGDIDYVNAHGTGTPANDGAEALAIMGWAGEHAEAMQVSSTKSMIGHLLGGAGAVEAAVCLLAMRGGWVPPSVSVREADEACGFDLVREARTGSLRRCLSNSFGFGGANASVVLGAARG